MKFHLLLDMLFELLQKRRLTAYYFTKKYQLSARTVYRYLEVLSAHVPLTITRGRNGGVALSGEYKLPVDFLTENEYEATMYALERAYAHDPSAIFLAAKRKISSSKTQEENDEFLY